MGECTCSGNTPVVSPKLGRWIARNVPESKRKDALQASFAWLTEKDTGVVIYEGITGRPYTDLEADLIGIDMRVVAGLPCPFRTENGECLVGGLGPHYNNREEAGLTHYEWLPIVLAKEWDHDALLMLCKSKQIADAKIAGTTRRERLNEWGETPS